MIEQGQNLIPGLEKSESEEFLEIMRGILCELAEIRNALMGIQDAFYDGGSRGITFSVADHLRAINNTLSERVE